jgi:hypothetical protein
MDPASGLRFGATSLNDPTSVVTASARSSLIA